MSNNELYAALAKAQGEIKGASKDAANPFHKSKYADLASVWEAIREVFSNHGLSIIQMPVNLPESLDSIGLRTLLCHGSGQSISSEFFQKLKDPSNPQVVGSALTYMRRYALMAFAGVAPIDDDGNAATFIAQQAPPGVTVKSQSPQPNVRTYQNKAGK